MSDAPPSRSLKTEDKRGFLQKLAEMLHPGPDSKDELIETLVEAQDNEVIGAQSREMLEGVIRMADMTAGDVMVAATRMDVINIDAPFDELLHLVIDTAHSRFPVYESEKENIVTSSLRRTGRERAVRMPSVKDFHPDSEERLAAGNAMRTTADITIRYVQELMKNT